MQTMNEIAVGTHGKFRTLVSSPLAMIATALAVRLVVMGFVYTSQLDPAQDHWNFGCEMGSGRAFDRHGTGIQFSLHAPNRPNRACSSGIPPFCWRAFSNSSGFTPRRPRWQS